MDSGLKKRIQDAIDKHRDNRSEYDERWLIEVLGEIADEQYEENLQAMESALGEDSDSFPKVCPVTGKEILDDCHITIEFGYGSDKDCTTYTFSPVADEVGKKVLESIGSMLKTGNIEEFGQDVMDETFGRND
jgi:hypothetical protein